MSNRVLVKLENPPLPRASSALNDSMILVVEQRSDGEIVAETYSPDRFKMWGRLDAHHDEQHAGDYGQILGWMWILEGRAR